MRDFLLVAIVFGSIPFILRKPHIGVLMWVWLSVMNPHRLVWDYAYGYSFAAIIAVVTLVSVCFSRDIKLPPMNGLTLALFLFVAWTGVTTLFAFYPDRAYELWITMMKTQLMVFLIPMLFHRKEHLRHLIWVLVLSIAYYGSKGGIFVLVTGGGERIFGPGGSFIEDNNALAVALVMTIPLMRYLQLTSPIMYVRWGLTAMMLLCGLSVLGSHSRGALIAIAAMVIFLFWKTRYKLSFLLVAAVTIPLALSFMPERWHNRMVSITAEQGEEVTSINMRFNSWATMLNIAKDRPITGGGFEVATGEVYARYSPDPRFPPQVAHSIYFQALGEHGYVGLSLFLLLLILFWRHAGALARMTRTRPDLEWAHHFGLMIQVSLIAFAAGGAFLSLVNFDVPYDLIGTLIAIRAIVDHHLRVPESAPVMGGRLTSVPGVDANGTPNPGST